MVRAWALEEGGVVVGARIRYDSCLDVLVLERKMGLVGESGSFVALPGRGDHMLPDDLYRKWKEDGEKKG